MKESCLRCFGECFLTFRSRETIQLGSYTGGLVSIPIQSGGILVFCGDIWSSTTSAWRSALIRGPMDRLPRLRYWCASFNALRDELVSTLLFVLGNREDAKDAAQDSFLKCWNARAGLPQVLNLRAWIFRVAFNTAKDMQRSAWNRRAKPLRAEQHTMAGKEAGPALVLENKEEVECIRRAIQGLRAEEKEVFLLRQNGDLTYEQIAEMHTAVPSGPSKRRFCAPSPLEKLRKVPGLKLVLAVRAPTGRFSIAGTVLANRHRKFPELGRFIIMLTPQQFQEQILPYLYDLLDPEERRGFRGCTRSKPRRQLAGRALEKMPEPKQRLLAAGGQGGVPRGEVQTASDHVEEAADASAHAVQA